MRVRRGIEGLSEVARGAQKLCVVILVKKADSNNWLGGVSACFLDICVCPLYSATYVTSCTSPHYFPKNADCCGGGR